MPDAPSIANLREEYARASLGKADVAANPFRQFADWLEEARATEGCEPTAMTLATVSDDGRPSARVVLLKAVDDRGFSFFTNLDSRKGRQLAANPLAAMAFWWPALERQVRVEGSAERVSDSDAQIYFASRPHDSKLGAWASPQSRPIASRSELDARMNAVRSEFDGEEVPLPPHWGGFRVVPERFEFWQGRVNRLHDRIEYQADGQGVWKITRLAP